MEKKIENDHDEVIRCLHIYAFRSWFFKQKKKAARTCVGARRMLHTQKKLSNHLVTDLRAPIALNFSLFLPQRAGRSPGDRSSDLSRFARLYGAPEPRLFPFYCGPLFFFSSRPLAPRTFDSFRGLQRPSFACLHAHASIFFSRSRSESMWYSGVSGDFGVLSFR